MKIRGKQFFLIGLFLITIKNVNSQTVDIYGGGNGSGSNSLTDPDNQFTAPAYSNIFGGGSQSGFGALTNPNNTLTPPANSNIFAGGTSSGSYSLINPNTIFPDAPYNNIFGGGNAQGYADLIFYGPPTDIYYATLKSKLDAGTYMVNQGQLNFIYFEKDKAGALNFKIYDEERTDVTSTLTYTKTLGSNSVSLDLNNKGFLQDKYYLLEVYSEKKELYFLAFKYSGL